MKKYNIICNTTGEVIDSTNTLNDARYLRNEYNLVYKDGVTILENVTDDLIDIEQSYKLDTEDSVQ